MKLLRTEVDLHEGYANPPNLVLIVDQMPSSDEFIYDYAVLGDSTLYYSAHPDGMVRFFAHNPSNEHGYGGSEYTLNVRTPITLFTGEYYKPVLRTIKGPWSSRASCMNQYFSHCVDCVIKVEGERLGYSAAVTLKLATQAAKMAGVELDRVVHEGTDDIEYVVTLPDELGYYESSCPYCGGHLVSNNTGTCSDCGTQVIDPDDLVISA